MAEARCFRAGYTTLSLLSKGNPNWRFGRGRKIWTLTNSFGDWCATINTMPLSTPTLNVNRLYWPVGYGLFFYWVLLQRVCYLLFLVGKNGFHCYSQLHFNLTNILHRSWPMWRTRTILIKPLLTCAPITDGTYSTRWMGIFLLGNLIH